MKRLLAFVAFVPFVVVAMGCSRRVDPYAEEVAEREAFAKRLFEEADAGRAFNVASTSEIQFEEGFSNLSFEMDAKDGHASFRNHAFRWMGQNAHVRLKAHGQPMKLLIAGWMHQKVVASRAVMNIYIDGIYVGSTDPIGADGHYRFEKPVLGWMLQRPWVNLTIRTSAVGFHWGDPPELKVLNVYRFGWTEAN